MEYYPILPAFAIPPAGHGDGAPPGTIAVRPGDLRRPGRGTVSALVTVPPAGRAVVSGEPLASCHQVTVAPAVVRHGGEVHAGGWLPDHVSLGVLEAHLPAAPAPGLRRRWPAAVAGNCPVPSTRPTWSTTAATCMSAWVSTPPVTGAAVSAILAMTSPSTRTPDWERGRGWRRRPGRADRALLGHQGQAPIRSRSFQPGG